MKKHSFASNTKQLLMKYPHLKVFVGCNEDRLEKVSYTFMEY